MTINLTLTKQLCGAAQGTSVAAVVEALDAGADPNQSDNIAWTPLRYASERGHADIVRTLLDRGADINRGARLANDVTYLHHAAKSGDVGTVRVLLDAGSDVNARDRSGGTPLHYAVLAQVLDATSVGQTLIAAGAGVTVADNYGATSLHRAAESANLALVEILLNAGANVHATDCGALTPLHYAANHHGGHSAIAEIVGLFLAAGALPDVCGNPSFFGRGATSLLLAVPYAPVAVIEQLLAAGANADKKTPLLEALPNAANFAALLAAGAHITSLLKATGKPALFTAAEYGNAAAIVALIAAGVDVNKEIGRAHV